MAIDFAGDDDYISCGTGGGIDSGGISLVCWVRDTAYGQNRSFIVRRILNVDDHMNYMFATSNVAGYKLTFIYTLAGNVYHIWETTDTVATMGLEDGKWHSIALTFTYGTGASIRCYVDGVSKAGSWTNGDGSASPINDATAKLGLAANYYNAWIGFVNAEMEDGRVANVAWTQEQISALAAGYRGPLGNEICWLSMNEARTLATPGTLTQGTHLLPDLSANSNDGDPYGGAVMVASDCPRMGVVI